MGAQKSSSKKKQIGPPNQDYQNDKIFHKKTNALQQPQFIYQSEFISGSQLLQAELKDFNDYIHTKNPKQTGNKRYYRDEDYSDKASSSIKHTMVAAQNDYRVATKKKFALRMDDDRGVLKQVDIWSFEYDKKLMHCLPKPQQQKVSSP